MNNDKKNELLNILEKCDIKDDRLSFRGYLVPDSFFDLDKGEVKDDSLSKFVIWVKSIPLNENREEQFLQIEKDIIQFTSNHSEGANGNIYVISDDLREFANWIQNKYPDFVSLVNIDALLQKYQKKSSIEATVVPSPVTASTDNMSVNDVHASFSNENSVVTPNVSEVSTDVNEVSQNVEDSKVIPFPSQNTGPANDSVAPSVSTDVNNNVTEMPPVQSNISMEQNSSNDYSFRGTPKAMDSGNQEKTNPHVLVRQKKAAGFVKFPIFLLTIIAIGAFGIFIGKMFYVYLSQR